MADPFVAEIRVFPFNFAPKGWAMCNGQLLPLSQNTALFSLLGTTYGGDGKSTFALPNLQGCTPVHFGQGPGLSLRALGLTGGSETVTLLQSEIPLHTHGMLGSLGEADLTAPGSLNVIAESTGGFAYKSAPDPATLVPMAPQALAPAGSSFPHNNMMPYLKLNFCIALQGVFPPRGTP
jgi:microcystin-dependent protein